MTGQSAKVESTRSPAGCSPRDSSLFAFFPALDEAIIARQLVRFLERAFAFFDHGFGVFFPLFQPLFGRGEDRFDFGLFPTWCAQRPDAVDLPANARDQDLFGCFFELSLRGLTLLREMVFLRKFFEFFPDFLVVLGADRVSLLEEFRLGQRTGGCFGTAAVAPAPATRSFRLPDEGRKAKCVVGR